MNFIALAAFLPVFFLSIQQETSSRVYTSDITNFWTAYDSIQTTDDLVEQIDFMQSLYINPGTIGLRAFMLLRNFDAKRLVNVINDYPKFW